MELETPYHLGAGFRTLLRLNTEWVAAGRLASPLSPTPTRSNPPPMTTFCRRRLSQFALPCCVFCLLAVIAAAANLGTARAQEPGVDLAVFTGRHQPGGNPVGNYLVVANYGGETAYGVRVEIEVNAGRHIVADLVDTSQRISDYRSLIELSNPSHGVVEFNVGGDPHRAVWKVGQLAGRSQHTVDLGFTTQENEYMELSFWVGNEAPEEPSYKLGDNAIEFLLLRPKNRSSIILFEAGSYSVQATVSPQTGGEVVFNITASLIPHVVSAIAQTHLLDALVETRLTGLEYVSDEVREGDARGMISEGDDDLYSHNSGANTGALAIGNWARGRPYTFHLELTTSPVDGAEEREQCLTAEISGFPEAPGVNGVDASTDNTARVCVEPQQPETPVPTILSDGEVSLFTWYDCVGQTDYPCAGTSAANNDQLQLVVVQGEANADTPPEEVLQPGDVIVHVPDPSGRYIIPPDNDDGEIYWSTGFADLSRSGVQLADSFPASANWDDNDDNTDGDPDGEVSIEYTVPSSGGIASYWGTNRGRAGDVLWGFNASNPYENDDYALFFGPLFLEFNRLGTYQMRFTIGANHDTDDVKHSDTETYTFHVGPIADLAVHETWQTAEGLSVAVVNNGPDRSPGARVVLDDTGESCLLGSMAPLEGRTCTIAGASLTGAGTVENHVPYEVCIDPHFVFDPHADNDSTIDAASEAECEGAPNNGSWHSVAVYDHDPSNNVITGLSDTAPVPEGVGAQSGQTRIFIGRHTVSWEPVEQLYGLDVAHYQVERLGLTRNRWKLIAAVPETSYDDTDENRGSSPRYRVRAVNTLGQFGPWAETGSGALPRLTLALDPATIKEPDPMDDPDGVTTATVTATLNKASGQDITVVVSAAPASGPNPAEDGDFTLSDNIHLMIPAGKLESTGVVTIMAEEDMDPDNERVSVSAVAAHVQANIRPVVLTIDDDDNPGLTLSPPAVTVGEGMTDTNAYTVKLDAPPPENMDVTVRIASGNNDVTVDTDPGEDGEQDTLTFTFQNWNTAQQVTVTAGQDADAANDNATITHTASGPSEYRGIKAALEVSVTDNDTAGVTVDPTAVMVEEGQTGEYTVSLATEPAGSVVIVVESDHDSVTVSPSRVSLDRHNYDTGRTVTVRVRNDNVAEPIAATLTHAVDADSTTADEYDGVTPIASVTVSVTDDEAPTDYDTDNNGRGDGLLEIRTREQLNAIRWDLDGNGVPDDGISETNAAAYARAFPRMMAGSCGETFDPNTSVEGDPNTTARPCIGYELENNITLSGNWTPIGGNQGPDDYSDTPRYTGEFNGNGHTIRNLRISLGNNRHVGLFGATGSGAVIENVGLDKVDVRGRKNVGALVGQNGGTISHAWSTGHVRGNALVGGLVGWNRATVQTSYSEASVTGVDSSDSGGPLWSTRIGGLVGTNYGTIANSYAWGKVVGNSFAGGLAGENAWNSRIENSYATGEVFSPQGFPFTAGLVGGKHIQSMVSNSYWDKETSGQSRAFARGGTSLDDENFGKKTTQLQGPTGATGIYQEWNMDADGKPIDVWNFGTSSEYPTLRPYVAPLPPMMQQGPPDQIAQPAQLKTRGSVTVDATIPMTLNEGGSATYTVVLDGQPTGDVTITASSDNGDVTVQPATLAFTTGNWQTPQGVTVSAAQDDDAARDDATISHAVSGAEEYAGIVVTPVSLVVTDDDAAGVTVEPTSLTLTEGATGSYEVKLNTRPPNNVLISVFSNNSDVAPQPRTLTFTPDNWQTPQVVSVPAAHDDDAEDEEAVVSHAIAAFTGSAYVGVVVPSITVAITDDDTAGVRVSVPALDLEEGSEGAYEVSLLSRPSHAVTISVSSDNPDVAVEPATLTFYTVNWETVQTVTVSARQDDDRADDGAAISHTVNSPGDYIGVVADSVTVTVTDDDSDQAVLTAFYQATGGAGWTNNANWLSGRPLGQWHGVTVNGQGQVTALVLDGNNLTGSLPAALGKLESLTRLALNRNGLSGAIPAELGSLTNLGIIGLARNSLSGALPAELGNLSGLTRLSLHDNTGLSGPLPDGFGSMSGLTRLAVSRTGLSGQLPQGLVNSGLEYLHFDDTSLCAPADEAFQTWLAGVADKNGPTCG